MKWTKRIAIFLVIFYLVICVSLYLFQDRLIFHPRQLPPDFAYDAGEEMTVTADDGAALNVLAFRRPGSAGAILFLHGNRGTNRRSMRQTEGLLAGNYDLYLMDYRGYGKSEGHIESETQLYSDAQAVYDSLRLRYAEEDILLVGYSLGTGMAAYLAANNEPQRLVLVAPYASITQMKNLWFWMFPDFILKYPLNTLENVGQARCPVTILHGETDELIPFDMAEAIREAAPERVEVIPLPETGHRGVILDPRFAETVLRYTR